MKKLALFFIISITLTGCSIIDNIETMSDHIDDTTNPNAAGYNSYNFYLKSLNKPENKISILELQNKRREAVNKTMTALRVQGYSNKEKKAELKQQQYAYQKILEAQKSVSDYLQSAVRNDSNKWKISADNALQSIDKAKHFNELNEYDAAENKLKLALLYLVNDSTALFLFQDQDKQVFPDYLKWGDNTIKDNSTVINDPDTLVFSGGGARCPAYAGVLKYLQEKEKLKNVNRFIGTSAGSIMCTLMSIGTYYENNRKPGSKHCWEIVYEIIEEANFIDFIDNPLLKKVIQDQNVNPVTDNLLSSTASISKSLDNKYALCDGTILLNYFKTTRLQVKSLGESILNFLMNCINSIY